MSSHAHRLHVCLSLCLALGFGTAAHADESAPVAAPADKPVALKRVAVGDTLSYERNAYVQPQERGEVTLDTAKTQHFTASVVSDDDSGRNEKYKSGVIEVYGKDLAFLGTIAADGTKKLIPPKRVLHWMPKGGLKAGMSWKINDEWTSEASNTYVQCFIERSYTAHARDGFRDVKIAGIVTHVPVIEVALEGMTAPAINCEGPRTNSTTVIAYSPDLDIVLDQDEKYLDPFDIMPRNSSYRWHVTAIN